MKVVNRTLSRNFLWKRFVELDYEVSKMSIKENFMYKKLRKVPEPRLPWKDYVSGLYMTWWSRLTLIQNVNRIWHGDSIQLSLSLSRNLLDFCQAEIKTWNVSKILSYVCSGGVGGVHSLLIFWFERWVWISVNLAFCAPRMG